MHDKKCFLEMLMKGLVGHYKYGMYKSWTKRKDKQHQTENNLYGIWPASWDRDDNDNQPQFEWRLSKTDVEELDARVCAILWPHNLNPVAYRGASFWTKSSRMSRTAEKHNILHAILPTCLRDRVPLVRRAVLAIVLALKRLDGQVYSYRAAKELGLRPGKSSYF